LLLFECRLDILSSNARKIESDVRKVAAKRKQVDLMSTYYGTAMVAKPIKHLKETNRKRNSLKRMMKEIRASKHDLFAPALLLSFGYDHNSTTNSFYPSSDGPFEIIENRNAKIEEPPSRRPLCLSLSRPCKRHVDRQDDQTPQIESFEDPQVLYLFQHNKKKDLSKAKKVWGIK
jgi:hypothetical protein